MSESLQVDVKDYVPVVRVGNVLLQEGLDDTAIDVTLTIVLFASNII